MRLSLKIKVSLFVALTATIIGAVTAFIFISASMHGIEKKQLARGEALSQSFARAIVDGLISEDLDLIKRAEYIVQIEDVELAQVFSTIWDSVDAYPFQRLKEPPDPDAINHFKTSTSLFYKKTNKLYHFYSPILFKPSAGPRPITVGYVRLVLSSSTFQDELKKTVLENIIESVFFTLILIIALNIFISRLVIKPIMQLRKSVLAFKGGKMPEMPAGYSDDEIGELLSAFHQMAGTIEKDTLAIKKAEEKFSKAFSSSPTLMSISTLLEGRFLEVNEAFLEAFGYSRAEVIGRTALELGIWDDPTDRDKIVRHLQDEGIIYGFETRIYTKSGEVLIVLFTAEIIDIESEQCILTVMLDITERKKLEDQLRQAQKMEAVGQLASGIAHDFNNILTAIIGFASIIKMKISKDDPLKIHIDHILASSQRGANLTKSLLAFSRQQVSNPLPVDINEIIRDIEGLLQSVAGGKIELKVILNSPSLQFDNIGSRKLIIMADRIQIDQVLINLCTNARDAMPDGGTLTIETGLKELDKEFIAAHGYGTPGSYALISVSDTGGGIDIKTRERMFEPFFTTKEVGKGTGLGLSIIYGIVKQHNGYIDCYSEQGKGSIFNIHLPILEK